MLDAAVEGTFKGLYIQGEDILQSDPDTRHVSAGLAAMDCVIVQDLFLNETANYAHVFLPGSTFLEKDGTFTNAERRINRVRRVMQAPERLCRLGGSRMLLANAMGARLGLPAPRRDHGGDRGDTTPTFAGVTYELWRSTARCSGPATRGAARHAGHAHERFRAGQRQVHPHGICGHRREDGPALPAASHYRAHPFPIQCRRADKAHRQCGVA
jgi:formate dehydrogenase major subunit